MIAALTSASVMSSWLMVRPITGVSANARRGHLAGRCRRRHVGKSPSIAPGGRVLEDDGVGPAAPKDERRREVGGVAERALALDDDDVGMLALERRDDGALHLARAELTGDGVERHAVARALDEPGLAGTDHYRLDAALVQRLGEDGARSSACRWRRRCRARRCAGGHPVDVAGEHAQVLLGARAAHVVDQHAGLPRRP